MIRVYRYGLLAPHVAISALRHGSGSLREEQSALGACLDVLNLARANAVDAARESRDGQCAEHGCARWRCDEDHAA
jgi:hypothetical protein